jgi:hypothetical protein
LEETLLYPALTRGFFIFEHCRLYRKQHLVTPLAIERRIHPQKILREKIATPYEQFAYKILNSRLRGLLGTALAYLNKNWEKLIRCTEEGDVNIDNNLAENAIRPFVIGRKNWMFSATSRGAHASAAIYSLIKTAKANSLEP